MSDDGFDEIVAEFLVESHENLDRYDQDLLALEQDPTDREVLSSIFRTIHTIKGTCGFFGFDQLESLTHVAENLLGRLREGELLVTEEIASVLLATGDAVRTVLTTIEETGAEGEHDVADLVASLTRLHAGEPAPAADEPAPAADDRLGTLLVAGGRVDAEAVDRASQQQDLLGDERRLGEILVDSGRVEPAEVAEALAAQSANRGSVADANIRVDVHLLDGLMNLVGELVLVRNQIVQLTTSMSTDSALSGAGQRLNLITTELQEGVMKTRMQPIGNVWSKLPRVVRDLAVQFDKQVRVEREGEDTELDKTILEAIKDPLTHLVRNAVDHGIESPEAREAAGKPAEGRLLLRAFHEGGQVNIEIADDGRGIDVERLRATAIERGVVTAEHAARMTERQVHDLVFAPGFSTAERVTNVSGRGVGMDVVRTNIERIGGTVDLQSRPGEGTTFRIKIPLTLAIIPALVVGCGGQRYAIPQVSLLELVRTGGDGRGIEHIHGAPVYRLRGELLPLVDLRAELEADGEHVVAGDSTIVVLQADDRQFGLIVDAVHDSAEIVVKPLGRHLKGLSVFAGATIMGDGRVGLILDTMGLAQRAHVLSEHHTRGIDATVDGAGLQDGDATTMLVCRAGGGHLAVPLPLVDRLEEFDVARIEWSGHREVVQYRGSILPLVRLGDLLPGQAVAATDAGNRIEVIVHQTADGGLVGIVVDDIEDVATLPAALEPASRAGITGTAVVDGRVTEVVDLPEIVRMSGVATAAPALA